MDDFTSAEHENDDEDDLDSNNTGQKQVVEIHFSKREFDSIVELVERKRANKIGRENKRLCLSFKSREWQDQIQKKVWEKSKTSCGFNFKSHKIYVESNRGKFDGCCNCGGTITGELINLNAEIVTAICTLTKGTKKCGKRYLRNPERDRVAKHLYDNNICPSVYRANQANDYIQEGDSEPGFLYSTKVLQGAKSEYAKSQYLYENPIIALAMLQLGELKNVIRFLSWNPFFVFLWSNFQLKVYKTNCEKTGGLLIIDETGSISRKIKKIDGSDSACIELYVISVEVDNQRYVVASMLSESHNANTIQFFLREFIRYGAPVPRETVSDMAPALLIALIDVFAKYSTISEYADACLKSKVSDCYVRIDYAHFKKKWVDFLAKEFKSKRVRKFYLDAITQLVFAKSMNEAKVIVEALLTISQGETDGKKANGQMVFCEEQPHIILDIICQNPNSLSTEDENLEQAEQRGTLHFTS